MEAEDYVTHVDAPASEIECVSTLIKAYKLNVKDAELDKISKFLNMNGIKQECGIFIAVVQPVWNASVMFSLIPGLQEDGHVYVVTDDIKHAISPCHYTFDHYSRDAIVPTFATYFSGISFIRRSINTCLALCPHILDKMQTQADVNKPKQSQEPSVETVWSDEPKDIDTAINNAIYDSKVSSLKESVKSRVKSELERIEKYKDFLLKMQDM